MPVLFTEAARFALRREFELPGTPIRMMLRKGKNPTTRPDAAAPRPSRGTAGLPASGRKIDTAPRMDE